MSDADDVHKLVRERMEKADKIRAAGMDPYANEDRKSVV